MALILQITSAGRTALSNAVIQAEALTISRLILTDGATAGALMDIQTAEDLGGTVVAELSTTGAPVSSGKIQIEAADTSDASYSAQTLALCYDGASGLEVFAVYSAEVPFIYKAAETTAQIVAAVSIDPSQVESITFSNVSLSFPPATADRNGAVTLATAGKITGPYVEDPAQPFVPTAAATAEAIKTALGADIFASGEAQIKSALSVGAFELMTFNSGWQAVEGLDGFYDQELGAFFDWRRAIGAHGHYRAPDETSHDFKAQTYEHLGENYAFFVDSVTQENVGGILKRSDGVWVLRGKASAADVYPVYTIWLRNPGAIDGLTASAHTIEAEAVEVGTGLKAGGAELLPLMASEFVTDGDGVWRRYGIKIGLVDGEAAHTVKIGDVASGTLTTATYDYASRSFVFGSTGYELEAATGILKYAGAAPSDVILYYTKAASIEASHAVKAYGHDIMRAQGCLGWVKFRFVSHPVDGAQLFIAASYQMTLELAGAALVATLSQPSGAADLRSVLRAGDQAVTVNYFEAVASAEVFGSDTKSARAFDVQGTDSVSFTIDTAQSFYGFIKVY